MPAKEPGLNKLPSGPQLMSDVVQAPASSRRSSTRTDLRPLKVRLERHIKLTVRLAALIVLVSGGILVYKLGFNKPAHILDDTKGLKFTIPAGFSQVSNSDLTSLNPSNVYGFKIANTGGVQCLISQTSRTKTGTVAPEALLDGTIKQIKLNYPDAQLIGAQAVALKNHRAAESMDVSYHDGGTLYHQAEVVALTNARSTFAYCASPDAQFGQYKTKFNLFFASLEVY